MGEIDAGRRDHDDGKGDGRTKPATADFTVAATGREPTTFDAIVQRVKRYVAIDDGARARTLGALNNDGRFRRHASRLYTRVDYTANGTNRVPAEDEAQGQ